MPAERRRAKRISPDKPLILGRKPLMSTLFLLAPWDVLAPHQGVYGRDKLISNLLRTGSIDTTKHHGPQSISSSSVSRVSGRIDAKLWCS